MSDRAEEQLSPLDRIDGRLQRLWSRHQAVKRFWRLDLAGQFMVAATIIVITLMLVLGYWANKRIENSILSSAGDFGGLYIQNFLTRHVQNITPDGLLPAEDHRELDRLLRAPAFQKHVETVKIWNRDGRIIYSDNKPLIGETAEVAELERALTGEIVTGYENGEHEDGDSGQTSSAVPLIEIYAPLRDLETGEVVAVGEFYERANLLKRDVRKIELTTWLIVAAVTIPMLALLYLIVRRGSVLINYQENQLRARLAEAKALALQNIQLRQVADSARVEATRTTETLLGRIGSDIHDGPVQYLSLMKLKLGRLADFPEKNGAPPALEERDREIVDLADHVMEELRSISAGLSLPELEHLDTEDVIVLAIERHENLTGSHVERAIEPLAAEVSHPLKICLYRIVQEGLRNAAKHAEARGQKVAALVTGNSIQLTVADAGPGLSDDAANGESGSPTAHLGLTGIRSRVAAFGGTFDVRSATGSGTVLTVTLPIG